MTWHASLLQSIVERQNHPDMEDVHRQSALDEKEWQITQRDERWKALKQMKKGRKLQMERDSRKRNFEEMTATEQHGKIQKAVL